MRVAVRRSTEERGVQRRTTRWASRSLLVVLALIGLVLVPMPAVAATTLPPPTDVHVDPQPLEAWVQWTRSVLPSGYALPDSDIRYTATASPGGASCSALDNSNCEIGSLTAGVVYTFTVVATDADGSSAPSEPSAPMTARDDVQPPAVSASVAPARLPYSGGDVDVVVRITDEQSGVDPASTEVHLEQGAARTAPVPLALVSGDAHDGTYTAQITLPPGSDGSWQVVVDPVSDVAGNSTRPYDAARLDVGLPLAPTDVHVEARPGRLVHVSWTPPPADTGLPLEGYVVAIGTPTQGGVQVGPDTDSADVDPGDVPDMAPIRFAVRAVNAAGSSPWSTQSADIALPAIAPAAPVEVQLVESSMGFGYLTWGAPSDRGAPITGYTVSTVPGGVICTGILRECAVTGSPGTPERISVTATNIAGTGPAADAGSFTPFARPTSPREVTWSQATSTGAVPVSWRPADWRGRVGTYVATATPGGATCTTSATSCRLVGLATGHRYVVSVFAQNLAGPSMDWTTVVVPYAPPSTVTRFSGRGVRQGVDVSWTAPRSNGAQIAGYRVLVRRGGWSRMVRIPFWDRSATVHGLRAGATYSVLVQAANRAGWSPTSSIRRVRALH